MKKVIFFGLLTTLAHRMYAMDHQHKQTDKLNVFVVPYLCGHGSSYKHVKNIIGDQNIAKFCVAATPRFMPDLGQKNCIDHLRKTLKVEPVTQGIIHAASQGTATTINYITEEDRGRQIKAVILESPFASGNSAIEHTATGIPFIAKAPLLYYWAPYVAKLMFLRYSPSGKQPIKSMQKMPKHVPIIFAHSKLDPQVSYNDTCALYYAARKNGNDAYLISKEEMGHLAILGTVADDTKVIQAILKKHTLIDGKESGSGLDLAPYQPDHVQFKNIHDNLVRKERNHARIGGAVNVGLVASVLVALKYFVVPAAKTFWDKKTSSAK